MDESLIYIIILIIIYVVRFFLKKDEEPTARIPDEYNEPPNRPSGPKRPTTFEELLEEMTQKEYREEEVEVKEYQPVYESLEDPYYQHQPERDEEARSVYEKSISQAKSFKTLDEQIDLEKVEAKIDEKVEKPINVVASKYADMLHNPRSVRDAIILSEILQRKYD